MRNLPEPSRRGTVLVCPARSRGAGRPGNLMVVAG